MPSVTVVPVVKRSLEPVSQELSTIKFGGKLLHYWLRERFAEFPEDAAVSICSDFWPDAELLAQIAAAGCNAEVFDPADDAVLLRAVFAGAGEKTERIPLPESSLRVTYPWQLLDLNEAIVGAISGNHIEGIIRPGVNIDGFIRLGTGSVVLPGVYIEGNVAIGKNCKIGPNCYIRGNTSIGDNCHIGQAVEIKNSLFMDKVSAGHLSYIGDSVVSSNVNFGAGTIVSNLRHDNGSHYYLTGEGMVNTGRRKFGMIVGEGVHTGIHTTIYPGRQLAKGMTTLPGQIVKK